MNLFLKAKHWQIFLFTFCLPFLLQIIIIVSVMANIFDSAVHNAPPDPEVFFAVFKFFPLMMVVFMGALFGWMWSIAVGLKKMIPPGVDMKSTLFKITLIYPLVYTFLFSLFIAYIVSGIFHLQHGEEPPPVMFVGFAVIFPLHLFAMFCMFYNIYFAAKTIKTVELQREVTFSDFVGEFFLIWFHFIGVWILQPRINKMVENYENGISQVSTPNSFS